MKEFIINNYLEDIRKIPAYDLMLEIIFNSILKIETNISQIKIFYLLEDRVLKLKIYQKFIIIQK